MSGHREGGDPSLQPAPGHLGFEACLVAAFGAFALCLVGRGLVFGSAAGRCVFPYVKEAELPAVLVGIAGAVVLTVAMQRGLRLVDRHPWAVVLAWLGLAFVFQVAVRGLYPIPLGRLVESDGCNSFYSPTLRWAPAELLRQWTSIASQLPQHAASNMPGKIFVYYFLELWARNPQKLGLLVIALSDLGCLLVFLVAKEWFGSARTGLLAFALAMLFPAKVGFFPLLNTVSPGFLLLALWLWLVYLRRQGVIWLLLLGASLYLLLFVEPLPLVAGLLFVGALVQRLAVSAIGGRALPRILLFTLAGFFAVDAAMRLAFRFASLPVFVGLVRDARAFNLFADRPYRIWVVQDLKEFFFGVGLVPALLYFVSLYVLGSRTVGSARRLGGRRALVELVADPAANLLVFFTLCLLTIDLLGIDRGEVTRLWIFLGVFLELVVAEACLSRYGERTLRLALGTVAFQTALTVSMVGFLIC